MHPPTQVETDRSIPGFRQVPRTGVIYVMERARQSGHGSDGEEWYNLGQGSPESGPIPGAPDRIVDLQINPSDQAYAPVPGIDELREKVADLYNFLYRRGKASQYGPENVSIGPGGRAAMTRLVAAMAPVNLGHFIPDYTAYEELLFTFRGFIPIPILLGPEDGYVASAQTLETEIVGRGLSAVLASNPCNPTGHLVDGQLLSDWIDVGRRARCTLVFDEFYSNFLYDTPPEPGEPVATVSAARYVDDVETDPVVLVNGLTKNWRYPGWRTSWIVGPRDVIDRVSSAGSFLDGGGTRPFQRAALDLLDPELVLAEAQAIQTLFAKKRVYMMERLRALGIKVEIEPRGAFYLWANLEELPEPFNEGRSFFEQALSQRVITVPGAFFDVNPGRRRRTARYQSYVRFSFGPRLEVLEKGLDRLEKLVLGR
ncbi:MAG: pyridoxal phosphate-dependent aminotransferase [Acidobacteriota bacterium]